MAAALRTTLSEERRSYDDADCGCGDDYDDGGGGAGDPSRGHSAAGCCDGDDDDGVVNGYDPISSNWIVSGTCSNSSSVYFLLYFVYFPSMKVFSTIPTISNAVPPHYGCHNAINRFMSLYESFH